MPTLLEVENVSEEMIHFFKSDNMEDDEGWMEQPTHCPGLLKHYSKKNINRSDMFSRAGEDKRRQSGPGARRSSSYSFLFFWFFFFCLSMQPWANPCSLQSLIFPIQQLKIIPSTLMLAETLSSLASKISYMKFYKSIFVFLIPSSPYRHKENRREARELKKRGKKKNPTFPAPSNGPAAYKPTSSCYSRRWLPQKHFLLLCVHCRVSFLLGWAIRYSEHNVNAQNTQAWKLARQKLQAKD